jgi:sigma-B regulation protein RsbU (phosphoserine phosphatase)
MCSSTDGNRFATLFYGIYDPARLTLSYVNAGHNPPIVLRRTPDAFEALRLQPTGTVLGVFPKVAFKKEVLRLSPGDVLVLFSDGVTEAMNEAEEFFGEDRLLALAARYANLPAEAMRDRILDEVERFAGGRAQSDDITLIVAKVAPEAAAQLPRFEAIRFTTEVN